MYKCINFATSELLGTTALHSHNIEKQCEITFFFTTPEFK